MREAADRRALAEDAVLVEAEPAGLELLRATGKDRISFLHRLLTADVSGLREGGGGRALLLTTKGHVTSAPWLFVAADEVRLVLPGGEGAGTAAALTRYAVMDDFTVTPDPAWACRALLGPAAVARLADTGLALPPDFPGRAPWSHVDLPGSPFGDAWIVRARSHGADGLWIWLPRDRAAALDEALDAAGTARLAPDAAEAARILAGEPRWGAEITADVFPMEVGLSPAIDYGKGCYLGQEPIVRIRDRGHVNWRLVLLRVEGERVPAAGDRLEAPAVGKAKAGRVTSAVRAANDGVVALALLHVGVPAGPGLRVYEGADPATAYASAVSSELESG